MYTLPTCIITEDNTKYNIRKEGDFRVILDCFQALNDTELDKTYRILAALFIFYDKYKVFTDIYEENEDRLIELIDKMFDFINCNEPQNHNHKTYKLIDWVQDEQLIMSSINMVAGREVRLEPYVHWWTFMGYYNAVGESSLSFVVSIRKKIITNQKLEKYEKEYRAENPQLFNWNSKTAEEEELDKMVMDMWNTT